MSIRGPSRPAKDEIRDFCSTLYDDSVRHKQNKYIDVKKFQSFIRCEKLQTRTYTSLRLEAVLGRAAPINGRSQTYSSRCLCRVYPLQTPCLHVYASLPIWTSKRRTILKDNVSGLYIHRIIIIRVVSRGDVKLTHKM